MDNRRGPLGGILYPFAVMQIEPMYPIHYNCDLVAQGLHSLLKVWTNVGAYTAYWFYLGVTIYIEGMSIIYSSFVKILGILFI